MDETVAIMVVLIVFVAVFGKTARQWLSVRHEEAKSGAGQSRAARAEMAQMRTHIAELEDRIQVLERITTDRGARLAREIDELRG